MDDDQEVVQAADDTPVAAEEQSEAKTDAKADAGTEDEAKTEPDAEGEEPEGDDDSDDDEPKSRRRSGLQRLKEQNARLRAQLELAQRSPAKDSAADIAAAVERQIGPPPKESDFSDYLAFERAMTAYTVKATLAEDRAQSRATEAQVREQVARQQAVEALREQQEEVAKAIPDYRKVVSEANFPVAPHVEELILDSDKPALLQYHLAKRPKLVARLNDMHPVRAAREMGRIERDLALPKPKTETKAPPPVQSVRGSATPNSPDKDLNAWLAKQYGKSLR